MMVVEVVEEVCEGKQCEGAVDSVWLQSSDGQAPPIANLGRHPPYHLNINFTTLSFNVVVHPSF